MFFIVNGMTLTLSGRLAEMMSALMRGPVNCPSETRRSAYVHKLRNMGVPIETERVKDGDGTRYGIYHLLTRARRATAAEVDALRAKAKAAKKAVRK